MLAHLLLKGGVGPQTHLWMVREIPTDASSFHQNARRPTKTSCGSLSIWLIAPLSGARSRAEAAVWPRLITQTTSSTHPWTGGGALCRAANRIPSFAYFPINQHLQEMAGDCLAWIHVWPDSICQGGSTRVRPSPPSRLVPNHS